MTNLDKLAVHGGDPVRSLPMPSRKAFGANEYRALIEAANYYRDSSGDPEYGGIYEQRYTDAFAKFLGGGHAHAVSTGSAALFVAVASLELPSGSEVLVSPISDPGTYSAIIMNGLVPRLVDTQQGHLNPDGESYRCRISENTKAMVVVHLAGIPAPMQQIMEVVHQYELKVIEDCAQSHGATSGGRPVGTFGDVSAFSTMFKKAHMTGSSGGVVYTNNRDVADKVKSYADRGKPTGASAPSHNDPRHNLFPALNFNIDEFSCAIGHSSLERLNDTNGKRLAVVSAVRDVLEGSPDGCCRVLGAESGMAPFLIPIVVDERKITCSKTEFANAVKAEGIPLNPDYNFLSAEWGWLKGYLSDSFPCENARDILSKTFFVYINENYDRECAEDIASAILKVEKHYVA